MKRPAFGGYVGFAASLAGLIAAVFLGYEAVERAFLRETDMKALHALHILRGVVSTLLGAALTAWFFRGGLWAAGPPRIGNIFAREGVLDQIDWLIRLRWLAICGVGLAIVLSQHTLQLLPDEATVPLWLGEAALVALNLGCQSARDRVRDVRAVLLGQVAADLVVLTWLLHFAGGAENPLFVLYVFHVIIAGILLPQRDALLVTAGAAVLFLFLAFSEYSGLLGHYTLLVFPHSPRGGFESHAAHRLPFVVGISAAVLALLSGTAWFTGAIIERLRENREHLLRIERLSALGELAPFIAHEINNPIGIISAQLKMMRAEDEASLPAAVKEGLEIADRQADRVGTLVQRLLSFTKPHLQSGSGANLSRVLSEALFLTGERLSKCGIDVERGDEDGLPLVCAGFNDAVHVFINLVNNAADAMPGGGTLRVEARAAGGWVEVSVSDSGEGIAEEDLERIFDPFFTTKSRDRGTGLGLPVSRALVKAACGEISVESAPGKGSRFLVRYPAMRGDGDREA